MAIWCILFLSSGYLRDEKREMSEIKESVYWMSYRNGLCVCVCVRVCVCVWERDWMYVCVWENVCFILTSSRLWNMTSWTNENESFVLLATQTILIALKFFVMFGYLRPLLLYKDSLRLQKIFAQLEIIFKPIEGLLTWPT